MAVSKRTRFEVLRRDGHRCRYCRREDLPLTVDHVIPRSLGGSDGPENLVAACRDCNLGKAASSPDETLVADVAADAQRWANALAAAAQSMLDAFHADQPLVDQVAALWDSYNAWGRAALPADFGSKIRRWLSLGLPAEILIDNVHRAWTRDEIAAPSRFRYFAGICWHQITELQQQAAAAVTEAVPAGWE